MIISTASSLPQHCRHPIIALFGGTARLAWVTDRIEWQGAEEEGENERKGMKKEGSVIGRGWDKRERKSQEREGWRSDRNEEG